MVCCAEINISALVPNSGDIHRDDQKDDKDKRSDDNYKGDDKSDDDDDDKCDDDYDKGEDDYDKGEDDDKDDEDRFFPTRKKAFVKYFEKLPGLQNAAAIFENECKDANDIFNAGITSTLTLHAAPQKIKDLNTLRYHSFVKATAKSICVK